MYQINSAEQRFYGEVIFKCQDVLLPRCEPTENTCASVPHPNILGSVDDKSPKTVHESTLPEEKLYVNMSTSKYKPVIDNYIDCGYKYSVSILYEKIEKYIEKIRKDGDENTAKLIIRYIENSDNLYMEDVYDQLLNLFGVKKDSDDSEENLIRYLNSQL
jgi:hypothetical protein